MARLHVMGLMVWASLVWACGGADEGWELYEGGGAGLSNRSVAVVFHADYPEVYGAIEVHVAGGGVARIDAHSRDSCKSPTFVVDRDELVYGAMSERLFFWSGTEKLTPGSVDCKVVELGVEGLQDRNIRGISLERPTHCFPYTGKLSLGPHEGIPLGHVLQPGFDVHEIRHPDRVVELRRLMEEASKGTIAVWGTGYLRSFEYRVDFVSQGDDCVQARISGDSTSTARWEISEF